MSPISSMHQVVLMSLMVVTLSLSSTAVFGSPVPSGNSVVVDDRLSSTSPVDLPLPSNDQADLSTAAQQQRNIASINPFEKALLQRASYRWAQQVPTDDLLNSIKDRIILVRPIPRYPFTRKRSCFIGAGMGNNCDFKDLISAASARRIWQSPNSPGKRSAPVLTSGQPMMADLLSNYYNSASSSPYVPLANVITLPTSEQHSSSSSNSGQQSIYEYITSLDESNIDSQSQPQASPVKRMQCISGLPGGDCENSFLGGESLGQDFLRPGGRNPGRR